MTEKVFIPRSPIGLEEVMTQILEKKEELLERYAVAFIAETGLKPSECELVVRYDKNEISYFFRRRTIQQEEVY